MGVRLLFLIEGVGWLGRGMGIESGVGGWNREANLGMRWC